MPRRPCDRGRAGRIVGKARQLVPAGAVLVVEAEGGREIVDAGFLLVGAVALLTQPEEALADDQLGERCAILALGRFAHLFAEGLEAGIGDRLRRRHRHRFVGSGLGRRRGLLATWLILRQRRRRAGDQQGRE